MVNCIFCKIISGEIPCHRVYEDEKFLAFLDANPIAHGHTLLIPKHHFENIFDIPEGTLEGLAIRAKKISQALRQSLGASGINLLHASGKSAQQSVFHFHLHLVPRYADDGLNTWPNSDYSEEDFEDVCLTIRREVV